MSMYDVNYFIKKFEAIPEELWTVGTYYEGLDNTPISPKCALGHCGEYNQDTDESSALKLLFKGMLVAHINDGDIKYGMLVAHINDGDIKYYQQNTAKKRILAALYDLKANEAVKEAEEIIKDKPESHEERMAYEDRQEEILDGTREDFKLNWKEGK